MITFEIEDPVALCLFLSLPVRWIRRSASIAFLIFLYSHQLLPNVYAAAPHNRHELASLDELGSGEGSKINDPTPQDTPLPTLTPIPIPKIVLPDLDSPEIDAPSNEGDESPPH